MSAEFILTCLQDVLDAINEMQSFFENYPMRYDVFVNDYLRRSAVERKVEIMGEAINRIRKSDFAVEIPHAKEIIATRNRIIHSYDNVLPEFLWSLVIRHIPNLKTDIERIIIAVEEQYKNEQNNSEKPL